MNFITKLILIAFCICLKPISLSCEIFQIRLSIEGMNCSYCARSVVDHLKSVKGLESIQVWAQEGIGVINWGLDTPFQAVALTQHFADTPYTLKLIEIDVEGKIEEKHGATILHSYPDNSLFYIDNRDIPDIKKLKPGDLVRIQGTVMNRQGFNFLYARYVLPAIDP